VTLNTKGRPGRWSRIVEVWTNDPERKMIVLSVSVNPIKEQQ